MATGRYFEKLMGQILTDFLYIWDITYSKILIRENLQSATRVTTETSCSLGASPTYATTNFDFLLPKKYGYNFLIDGIARGNVKLHLYAQRDSFNAGEYFRIYGKATMSIRARDSSGTDRVLATSATTQTLNAQVRENQTYEIIADIPLWFDVDNQRVLETEMLILRVAVEGMQNNDPSATGNFYLKLNTDLNTDNVMVELPLVM